jgi:flavodoxin short chain
MPHQLYIMYESHTGNTHKMAQAVAEGAREVKGVEVLLKRVSEANAEELANADAIILGAPTRNTKIPPAMTQFLKDMKGVPLQGKPGAAFGSYGWSGEAVGLIRSAMIAQGIRVPGVGVRAKRTPDKVSLQKCRELGIGVATRVVKETA